MILIIALAMNALSVIGLIVSAFFIISAGRLNRIADKLRDGKPLTERERDLLDKIP